jgi:hypothetical protein
LFDQLTKRSFCASTVKFNADFTKGTSYWFDWLRCLTPLLSIFSYIMVTSFSGGRSWSTRREPPTMGKQLVNFITCDCESSAPFFVIYNAGREPTPYWW